MLVVAYAITRSIAVDHVDGPDAQAAARAVWDAFLGDLRTAAWILAGAGAVVAAAASSLIRPLPFGEPLRAAAAWLARSRSAPRCGCCAGSRSWRRASLVLVDRDAVLALLLNALGIYLIYEGVSAILRLVYREERARRGAAEPGPQRRFAAAGSRPGSLPAIAVIAVVARRSSGTGGDHDRGAAEGTCNGHRELCDRPLDEVALAVTHNSMSVPLPGWYSSMQEAPIADQLHDGIRGLLIDTHYADQLPNGKVRTYFGSTEELEARAKRTG